MSHFAPHFDFHGGAAQFELQVQGADRADLQLDIVETDGLKARRLDSYLVVAYGQGGQREAPLSGTTTSRFRPVPWCVAVTLAPDSGRPDGSVIVPVRVARSSCAMVGEVSKTMKAAIAATDFKTPNLVVIGYLPAAVGQRPSISTRAGRPCSRLLPPR